MAKNKKNRPVDKKHPKKVGDAKGFWNKGRSSKNVEVENPLVLEEERLDDTDKGAKETVEQKLNSASEEQIADVSKPTEDLTDQADERIPLFEQEEDNERLAASENKDNVVVSLNKAKSRTPELFADNSEVETLVNETLDRSKKEDDHYDQHVDESSDGVAVADIEEYKDLSAAEQSKTNSKESLQPVEIKEDSVPFDPSKPVYMEIHRGNIFHYYMGGLLLASKYIEKRAFTDIQNLNEDFLILANSGSHGATSDHILLEIDMTGVDNDYIVIHDNFALLATSLPVTRVKSILAQNTEIKKSIVNDALLFNGGFIPEGIISIKQLELKQKFDFKSVSKIEGKEYEVQIDKFDRILGLLAFLRNYDLLISERSKVYKSLSSHFFYAMQALDEGFGIEIVPKNIISEFYIYLFNDSCPPDKSLLKWLFERVQQGDNFTDADILAFGKELKSAKEDSPAVRNVLSLLSRNLDRKKALQAIDELKPKSGLPLYIFAFLRNYGNLNSIDVARRDLSYVYSSSFGEYAFALLGYFYGYKNLRNTDERLGSSEITSAFVKGKAAVKFQLTTRFDYRVIELVYQFVFKTRDRQVKDSLKIRENIEDEKLSGISHIKKNPVYEKLLFGKLYQRISFVDPFDKLLEQLSFLPNEIPLLSTFGTFCYQARVRFIPYAVSDWGGAGFIPDRVAFLKKDLLSYLSEHKDRIDMEEILLRIQLEKKMIGK